MKDKIIKFIEKKAKDIGYGKFTIEITVKDGKVSFIRATQSEETVIFGD